MFTSFNIQIIDVILSTLILMPMLLACYNLIIVPQKLLRKHVETVCNQIKPGNKVDTYNGFKGTVTFVFKNTIILELENGCKTEILKQSVKTILE